jgi:SAM-dependent methyltransferase
MDRKDAIRDGYDAVSNLYRPDNAEDGQYGDWLDELARYLPHGGTVLDLGCGCGVPTARWLIQHGYGVTGVDFSAIQIERARQLVPDAAFLCADVTTLDLPQHSVDAVVSFFAIIHVPLAEQPKLFHAIHQWLKPGGWLMATVGALAWTGAEKNWLGGGAPMYWSHEGADTYLRWLDDADFTVVWHRFVPEGDGGHTLVLAHV